MAKTAVLDELHVTFRVPSDMLDTQTEEIGLTFRTPEFMNHVRRVVRNVIRIYPDLALVTVTVSR